MSKKKTGYKTLCLTESQFVKKKKIDMYIDTHMDIEIEIDEKVSERRYIKVKRVVISRGCYMVFFFLFIWTF